MHIFSLLYRIGKILYICFECINCSFIRYIIIAFSSCVCCQCYIVKIVCSFPAKDKTRIRMMFLLFSSFLFIQHHITLRPILMLFVYTFLMLRPFFWHYLPNILYYLLYIYLYLFTVGIFFWHSLPNILYYLLYIYLYLFTVGIFF